MRDSNESSAVYREEYDRDTTPPTTTIIRAIASIEGVDPSEFGTTYDMNLHEYIVPEALDRILSADSDVTLSFVLKRYRILVTTDEVQVRRI